MEISTVYTCQDTESECGTETEQCVADSTHKCNRVVETNKWLSEDLHRQRCEVKARRDAKMCCKILTALGRREWKTWNDVSLELKEEMSGYLIVRQLSSVQRNSCVWHHPQSEKCERR